LPARGWSLKPLWSLDVDAWNFSSAGRFCSLAATASRSHYFPQ
jgi:hypothetical protein